MNTYIIWKDPKGLVDFREFKYGDKKVDEFVKSLLNAGSVRVDCLYDLARGTFLIIQGISVDFTIESVKV